MFRSEQAKLMLSKRKLRAWQSVILALQGMPATNVQVDKNICSIHNKRMRVWSCIRRSKRSSHLELINKSYTLVKRNIESQRLQTLIPE